MRFDGSGDDDDDENDSDGDCNDDKNDENVKFYVLFIWRAHNPFINTYAGKAQMCSTGEA